MFVDIYQLCARSLQDFSDSVRDDFGNSVVQEVYQPLLTEIVGLMQMQEHMEQVFGELRQLNEELKAIGCL